MQPIFSIRREASLSTTTMASVVTGLALSAAHINTTALYSLRLLLSNRSFQSVGRGKPLHYNNGLSSDRASEDWQEYAVKVNDLRGTLFDKLFIFNLVPSYIVLINLLISTENSDRFDQ